MRVPSIHVAVSRARRVKVASYCVSAGLCGVSALVKDPSLQGAAFFGAVAVLLGTRVYLGRRLLTWHEVLQAPTADDALARTLGNDPSKLLTTDGPARVAQAAILFTLYGELEPARRELATVEWLQVPPAAQTLGFLAQALLDLLDRGDFGRARNLLRRAEKAATEAGEALEPRDLAELKVVLAAADVLMEDDVALNLQLLEARASGSTLLAKLIGNWALASWWSWEEEKAKAEAHFAICRALAPHCVLLHRTAPRPAKRITR